MTTDVRIASVDALRGLTVAAMLLVNTPGDWSHVYAPLRHADWHGCTATDLIFPLFLFIVGVSLALALATAHDRGVNAAQLRRGVLLRAARLVAVGLGLHLCAYLLLQPEHFRLWGVLQRIGVCFAAVGMLAIYTRPRTQWLLLALLLIGYTLALTATGGYEPWSNLASRIDTALFAPYLYQFDPLTGLGHDPEGLLTTLPAIATTLLGLRAGAWLRRGERHRLFLAAVVLLLLGWLGSHWQPWNKQLWTPSYVLWTGGWACGLALLMHVLVDRSGWPAIGRSLGVNAIVAYTGSALMVYGLIAVGAWSWLYQYGFAGWMTPSTGAYLPSLAFAVAFVSLWWALMHWLERCGWQIRI